MNQNQFVSNVSQQNNPESIHKEPYQISIQHQKNISQNNDNSQNHQIQQNQESIKQNKQNEVIEIQQIQQKSVQNYQQQKQDQERNLEQNDYKQNEQQGQLQKNGSQQSNNFEEQPIYQIKNQEKLPKRKQFDEKHQNSNKLQKRGQDLPAQHKNHKTSNVIQNKLSQRSESFLWGEDELQSNAGQNKKRSYSQFFLNNKLARNGQIFSSKKQKFNKNEKIQENKVKMNQQNDIDIWQDLRNSMIQKSRISNQVKKSKVQNVKKVKSNKKQILSIQLNKSEKFQIIPKSKKRQEKQNILKLSKQDKEVVQNIADMNKLILQKVLKWKKQNKQIQSRRLDFIQIQQQRIKNENIHEAQKIKNKVQLKKEMRVKAISQRLQKKQKKKRKITTSPPKQDGKNKNGKAKKSKSQKGYKKIHEAQSLQIPKNKQAQPQEFSIHWKRKNNEVIQQKQKLLRRKIFQQKIRQIPVNISSNKKLKLLIQIDKSQNPLKYQFLQKKGLDDEQIYRNQKQFKLPESPKKIGIQYLQDLRQKSKIDDLRRYMSQQSLLNIKKYQRDWKSPNLQKQYKIQKQAEKLPALFNPHSVQYKKRKLHEQDNQYLNYLKK